MFFLFLLSNPPAPPLYLFYWHLVIKHYKNGTNKNASIVIMDNKNKINTPPSLSPPLSIINLYTYIQGEKRVNEKEEKRRNISIHIYIIIIRFHRKFITRDPFYLVLRISINVPNRTRVRQERRGGGGGGGVGGRGVQKREKKKVKDRINIVDTYNRYKRLYDTIEMKCIRWYSLLLWTTIAVLLHPPTTRRNYAKAETIATQRSEIQLSDESGAYIGALIVEEGQHAVKTIEAFCDKHELSFKYCTNILSNLCENYGFPCEELARQPIQDQNGRLQANVVVYDGQRPASTIRKFCSAYEWGEHECGVLLSRMCDLPSLDCGYLVDTPVILAPDQPPIGHLRILDGQPVVKHVLAFCAQHVSHMRKSECQFLLDRTCETQGVECPIRFESRMLLSLNGVDAPKTDIGNLIVYEGQDPLDAVQAFCFSKSMSTEVCAFVKNQACMSAQKSGVACVERPLVSLPIADENNVNRGTLQVFLGQEPADVVEAFVRTSQLPKNYFSFLIRTLCDGGPHGRELRCSRRNPALDFIPVFVPTAALEDDRESNSPDDQYYAGIIFVWDIEEEYADYVYDFFKRHRLPLEYRWPFLRKLCEHDVASCTRAEGRIASLPVKHEGKDKGELELFEHMEPAEAVLKFAEDKGMTAKRTMLMEYLCMTSGGAPLCKDGRALSHARRQLFDMKLTFMGLSHTIRYMTSTGGVDTWDCDEIADGMGEECTHIGLVTAREFCSRFARGLGPNNCEKDIVKYMTEQIDKWENRRWAGKEYYEYLDVPIDADLGMIEMSYRRQLRTLGSDAKHSVRRQKLKEAYDVLSDPKKKAYYDQPCKEFPGLSGMCVKHLPDGGMNIICGGSKI